MKNYNLVIVENKQCIPFLNLTEQAFYDKLWEWAYIDDLWDYLVEINPTDEEELNNVLFQFINENIFHRYEDDDIDCFAFVSDDIIKEYEIDDNLYDFVKSKIKEYYEKV